MSEPQERNDTPAQQPEQASAPTPKVEADSDATATPNTSLCGVCSANPPKYKCPRCRLPYCSVACNKIHRENHPPDPEPPTPQPEPSQTRQPSQPQSCDPSNPFHALEGSDKLRLLFQKYPSLPEQLLKIDAATLPPSETKSAIPASLLKGLPPKQEAWNHDIGMQNGKEALRKARRADGEQGDAIREYSELILHLLNTENANADADSILRQQIAQEDTKLIERLMAQEKR
ncbi:Zinc finger HIT domain-containing protein 3 [Fusarium austroafricanum]|uniref:Zinc finger HIT domain-containing protein 3 n=1 Tax=Fusarium austroafricanum TaxID=2364996 RepID=A0A8H4KTJ8_9HYPO|nr:Zinc finger HIT domain-containing protein 3 [Fusarium austroafricanum]